MSLVEKARERLEEVRAKGAMAVLRGNEGGNPGGIVEKARERLEEVRARGLREGGILRGEGILGEGILGDVREKGVLGVLEEKFPRVKEIRERGLLGGVGSESKSSGAEEGTEASTLLEEKEPHVKAVRARVLL